MKSVKVGPTDFSIEYVPLNDELFGDFSYINSRIRIEENLKGTALVDTVLHEILHAIWKLGQLKDKREELELLAQALLEKEVLLKSDVERLVGARPFDADGVHATESKPEPTSNMEGNPTATKQSEKDSDSPIVPE